MSGERALLPARSCGHKFLLVRTCDECRRFGEARQSSANCRKGSHSFCTGSYFSGQFLATGRARYDRCKCRCHG